MARRVPLSTEVAAPGAWCRRRRAAAPPARAKVGRPRACPTRIDYVKIATELRDPEQILERIRVESQRPAPAVSTTADAARARAGGTVGRAAERAGGGHPRQLLRVGRAFVAGRAVAFARAADLWRRAFARSRVQRRIHGGGAGQGGGAERDRTGRRRLPGIVERAARAVG